MSKSAGTDLRPPTAAADIESVAWLASRSPDGFLAVNPDGTVAGTNAAFRDALGWPGGSLEGQSVETILHPADAGMWRAALSGPGGRSG